MGRPRTPIGTFGEISFVRVPVDRRPCRLDASYCQARCAVVLNQHHRLTTESASADFDRAPFAGTRSGVITRAPFALLGLRKINGYCDPIPRAVAADIP